MSLLNEMEQADAEFEARAAAFEAFYAQVAAAMVDAALRVLAEEAEQRNPEDSQREVALEPK